MSEAPLEVWNRELERACQVCGNIFSRVVVVGEASSTQDIALARCGERAGLIVAALRQTAGRGRLGRAWADTSHLGVALTCVVDATKFAPGVLALAAGLAAARTVGEIVDLESKGMIGLRWPNDVVERTGKGRKLAGVLIEQADGRALVGIGVNVNQASGDFPTELRETAVSIAMLAGTVDRLSVACMLVSRLQIALLQTPQQVAADWSKLDVLVGSYRTFEYSGSRFSGRVEHVNPLGEIVIVSERGDEIRLPALATSLV